MRYRVAACALLAAIIIQSGCSNAQPVDDVKSVVRFIPAAGVYAGRTMQLQYPREVSELTEKWQESIRRDPEWLLRYSKEHEKFDGPLPWHPNMGLTKAEYDRLGSLYNQVALAEVERTSLTVVRASDGGLVVSATGHASFLNGAKIYLSQNYVDTKYGRLHSFTTINQRDPKSPTGRWKGVQWSNDEGIIPRVKLAFGRTDRGENIVYYDVTPRDEGPVIILYR